MAGVPVAPSSSSFNGGPNYGNTQLPGQVQLPSGFLSGTGVSGLTDPSWAGQQFNPQDITAQYNNQQMVQKAIQDLSNNYYGPDNNKVNSLSADFNAGTNFKDLSNQINSNFSGNPAGSQAQDDLAILQEFASGNANIDPTKFSGNYSGSDSIGNVNSSLTSLNNQVANAQNANVAGYNATNSANANNLASLQKAAIAENQLLGDLSSRGMLQSYEKGGLGSADMEQLQNSLNAAQQDQGAALQTDLSGILSNQQQWQVGQQSLQNQLNQFNNTQQNSKPGFLNYLTSGLNAAAQIAPFIF